MRIIHWGNLAPSPSLQTSAFAGNVLRRVIHTIQPPDILPAVLSRVQELGETPLAHRLSEIPIGPTSLWDALRYDVADALYDDAYRELMTPREPPPPSSGPAIRSARGLERVRGMIARNLWQGQVGEEFLVGLLSARLGLLGDLLEAGCSRAVRRGTRRHDGRRVHVLVAGSMYRAAVAALSPALHALGRDHGLAHLVVAHDDVLWRHGRAFHRLGLRWRHAATFSNRAHCQAASEVVDRARTALADAGGVRLPDAVSRRSLSERHLRRLVVNFLAAQEALGTCDPSVVVIPDERQPLARLVGLEACRRGLPVVSAPLARDQIYRKAPLGHPIVSTRIFVFSPMASRFLGRAGAPPDLFEHVTSIPLEPKGLGDQAPERSAFRDLLALPSRTRIVLFASQGQPANSILLPMLAARTAALPDVALVIRPHPNEWRPMVKLMNRGVYVSNALTARQAIHAADVLVTHSSFMAVEAALLGRPVLLVSPEPVPSLLPLISEGLARWTCTSAGLQRALEELLGPGDGGLRAAQARFREEQARLAGPERAADVFADLARARS